MKSTKPRVSSVSSVDLAGGKIAQLEILVDELIKDAPQETRIRTFMKAAGLPYSADPIDRMNSVLEALNGARARTADRGREREPNL